MLAPGDIVKLARFPYMRWYAQSYTAYPRIDAKDVYRVVSVNKSHRTCLLVKQVGGEDGCLFFAVPVRFVMLI
jgi:hypothetical protein